MRIIDLRLFTYENDFRYGKRTVDGLKSVSEIAVAKILVQNLAEFCIGKQKEFRI